MNELIFNAAFQQAELAFQNDEVPVGAVVFDSKTNEIITKSSNSTQKYGYPTAHAELLAIKEACMLLHKKRLTGYSIFVTLEPCAMCAAALSIARFDHVYFGAFDPKTGGICQGCQTYEHPQTHHKPKVTGGINADVCGKLLSDFFKNKRGK